LISTTGSPRALKAYSIRDALLVTAMTISYNILLYTIYNRLN
jgi:hypothetical protein